MAASSILTPSQSGIIGEGGRKVLKTRVQVLGRYLVEPGVQALSTEAAVQLVERAKAGRARVRTPLTLFSNGLRLGERGLFASMKFEFIEYFRLSDIVTPPGYSALLVICAKDYEQRCATVLQFKDEVCLKVVLDVIDRHRHAALDDDVARISDLQSLSSELRLSAGGRNAGGGGGDNHVAVGSESVEGNWHLVKPVSSRNGSLAGRITPVFKGDVVDSVMTDESDYAVIRKSRVVEAPHLPSRSGGESREDSAALPQQQMATNNGQNQQPRYQKNNHLHHLHPPQHHQKRYSWNTGSLAVLPDANAAASNLEEIETAAIFETPEGPPTLLNELVRRSKDEGFGESRNDATEDKKSRQRRISEVPPEYVARIKANGGAQSVLRQQKEQGSAEIVF